MKKEKVEFVKVNSLKDLGKTKRGSSGFGSSDLKKVKFDSDYFDEEKEEEKIRDENKEVIVIEEGSLSVNGKEIIKEKSTTVE